MPLFSISRSSLAPVASLLLVPLFLGACSSGKSGSDSGSDVIDTGLVSLAEESGIPAGTLELPVEAAERLSDLVIVQGQEVSWSLPAGQSVPVRVVGLPEGLRLDTANGQINGRASNPGSYSIVIETTANDQGEVATYAMTIGVVATSYPDLLSYSHGNTTFIPQSNDIADAKDFYQLDDYDNLEALRVDVRTATVAGVCSEADPSGCTLLDVNLDIDGTDSFKVEIPVHVTTPDFADDGSDSNAELRQRGATSRQAPQKSYRIKLDSKEVLWRDERRMQLNKHPYDQSRIRNKLSFDLMAAMPHLPSLRTQFVNLWIDDGQGPQDYGLFTHVEAAVKEYLVNRSRDKDDYLYKIEALKFSKADLSSLALDEEGEPVDIDLFESIVEIKRGENHQKLLMMIAALNDPEQPFDSVFDRYFNANNVLMWFTANLLMGQKDAIFHNFYLYNPQDSDTFYFLPWDYDAAFFKELIPGDSFSVDDLRARLGFGYAKTGESIFLARYLSQPGMHAKIVAAAQELRNSFLSREVISQRATQLAQVARPFVARWPDSAHVQGVSSMAGSDRILTEQQLAIYDDAILQLEKQVEENFQLLMTEFSYPLPARLEMPRQEGARYVFEWSASVDVTGGGVSHDFEVATSSSFNRGSIVFRSHDIVANSSQMKFSIAAENLPRGRLFYRVISRSDRNPDKYWQVPANVVVIDGVETPGMVEFVIP